MPNNVLAIFISNIHCSLSSVSTKKMKSQWMEISDRIGLSMELECQPQTVGCYKNKMFDWSRQKNVKNNEIKLPSNGP